MPWAGQLMAYRSKHRMKQYELAEKLDVDERIVRRWEKGLSVPSARHQQRIHALLAESGEVMPVGKRHFHCSNASCIFGLPLAAALFPSPRADHVTAWAVQCSGVCELAHEQVRYHFSGAIADGAVMELKARFHLASDNGLKIVFVHYTFLRHLVEPILVAECRAELAASGEVWGGEGPRDVVVTRIVGSA